MLSKSKTLNLLVLFLAISLLPSSCQRMTDFSVYRFIDHFTEDNLLLSPFQEMAADPDGFKEKNPILYNIADKSPLLDAGIGKNPLLLKKKPSFWTNSVPPVDTTENMPSACSGGLNASKDPRPRDEAAPLCISPRLSSNP